MTAIKVPTTMTRSVTESYQTFSSFTGQVMPNPDSLIRNKGVSFDVFREMLLDGTIYGKFEQLFGWIKTKKLEITGRYADTAYEALSRCNPDRLLSGMLTSVQFGYSVQEIVWADPKETGGRWLIESVTGRPQEKFGFGYGGELKYNNNGQLEDAGEEFKFIVTRHNSENGNYYGTPVLAKCYWYWMFKKAGFRFWVTAAEKFGVPTVLALFESDDPAVLSERAEQLAMELSKIQNDAAVALANVSSVQTLEASGNAQGMFKDFVDMCNAEISKAVTGETMTTENGGGSGSYALGAVHADTLDVRAQSIAGEIARTLQDTVVRWAVQLNHGFDAEIPEVTLTDVPQATFADVMSAVDRGIPVSLEAMYTRYGLPKPKDDQDGYKK